MEVTQPTRPEISVIAPVYGCANLLNEFVRRVDATMQGLNVTYEILFIDDRSPDNAWQVICDLSQKWPTVRGVRLSRNFGQQRAISAGLHYSQGNWCVVMDCDLQDQPEEIPKLYNKALEGYDTVLGRRRERQDDWFKTVTSRLFYMVFNFLSGINIDHRTSNFGICSRRVVDRINALTEKDRAFAFLTILVGFKRAEVDVEHAARKEGKSSYNFSKRLNMAIGHILSHSTKPLLLSIQLGMLIAFFSFMYGAWLIFRYFFLNISPTGWTSIMVSMYFLAGLVITIISMVGIYVGKIYEEVKGRPLFIVDETTFEQQ